MGSIINNGQFLNSFQGFNSSIPICGIIANRYENFDGVGMFQYQIAPGSGQAVFGNPVTIMNQAGGNSTSALSGLNANTGAITALATSIPTISGFLAQSSTDILPLQGGDSAYPVEGMLSLAALLGSGCQMWLPASAAMADIQYGAQLTWDFAFGYIRPMTAIVNEPDISKTTTGVSTANAIASVAGVWLATDPNHLATNYYSAGSSFTGQAITLATALPGETTAVLISYSDTSDVPLPTVRMITALTAAKKLVYDNSTQTAAYEDCMAVEVVL